MLIFFPPFHRCFATHPSLWLFQLVPANDCDLFNLACDEGPSNSPQSPFKAQKKVEIESNVVAMATCWQPPLCTESPHNEQHWLFPTLSLGGRGGAAWKQGEVLSSTKPRLLAGERATKGSTQTQCSPCVHVAGWWVCSVYSIWPFRWGQGLLSFLMTGWLALHLHSTLAETKLILIKIAHIATIVELWYLC